MAVLPNKKKKVSSAKADDGEAAAEDVVKEAVLEKKKKGKKRAVEAEAEAEPEAEVEAKAGKGKKKAKAVAIDPESLPEPKFYRVVVRGHAHSTKTSELKAFFEEKCGEVKCVQTMEGRHRGLAFVELAGRKGFNKALKLNNEKFGDSDKILKVRPSKSEVALKEEADEQPRPKKKRKRTSRKEKAAARREKAKGEVVVSAPKPFEVFVGNLPFETKPEQIMEDFGKKCGPSVSFVIPQHKHFKAKHKGMAFIQFDSEEGVEKALAMSGTDYEGMKVRVERSGAYKKEKKEGEGGGGGRGGGRGGGGRGSGPGRGVKRKGEAEGGGKSDSDAD